MNPQMHGAEACKMLGSLSSLPTTRRRTWVLLPPPFRSLPCAAWTQPLALDLPLPRTAGDKLPSHVAVVRDAFGAHDDSHRALGAEVAALGPQKVGRPGWGSRGP